MSNSSLSYASTSMPNPAPTPPSMNEPPPSTRTVLIIGVVFGLATGLFILAILIFTIRTKRRTPVTAGTYPDPFNASRGSTISTSHPAARITPFGSPGAESPRFKHIPGSDMRVAVRRPDGTWQFTEPGNTSEADLLASPPPSHTSCAALSSSSSTLTRAKQEQEYSARDHDVEANLAPPAYSQEYRGYINHAKSPSEASAR